MKAYGVVRKPAPSNKTVQHTFKVQRKNPQISIDPIQHNRSITPRKADQIASNHLLQRKSKNFKIEDEYTQPYRHSRSPPRKHPIFNQMITEFMKQKNLIQSEQKAGSGKAQQINQNQPLNSRFQNNFDFNTESKVNSRYRQAYTTPQKVKHQQQKITPYQILNRSQKERSDHSLTMPHRYKIFERYENKSKQKKLSSYQRQQVKANTLQRALAPQLQYIKHRSQQLNNENPVKQRQNTQFQTFRFVQQRQNDQIRVQDLSDSQIDLGCCGEYLEQKKKGLNTSAYRLPTYVPAQIQNKNNVITNGIGLQLLSRNNQRSTEKSRRKIFNQHNPQLLKSNQRETVSYKEDKIKSKPLMIEQRKSKQLKVTVFEVSNQSPFEF